MKRFMVLVIAALILAVPFGMVLGQGPASDTVIRSISYDMVNLNPILLTDGGSGEVSQFIYSGLFEVDPMNGVAVPGLTSWEISEDGMTYTFTIREGAVWSDGTPITSADVEFSYNAIINDSVESPRKSNMESIASFTVIDDRTFELVLGEVNCTIWSDLANLTPLPKHKFAEDFSDMMTSAFNTAPDVASGPYIFDVHEPDEYTRLVANPTYWGGAPKIPALIIKVLADTAIQNQALMAGEVDYAFMYPDDFAQIPNPENLNAFFFPLHNTPLFVLNWANPENPQPAFDEEGNRVEQDPHPIFADVRVRQAVAMGYDKDAILATLGEGGGVRLTSSVIPTITWAYNEELTPWPYDPGRAAALLEEAGWIDQDGNGIRECHGCLYAEEGTPLAWEIVYTNGVTSLWDNIAIVAQDQLSQLGMEVALSSVEWGAFLNDFLLAQKFDALVVGFGGGTIPDPSAIAYNIMLSKNDVPGSGFNMTSYVNEEVDQLLEDGLRVPGCSVEDRSPIYYEMQRITQEEVAYDFTITPSQVNVMNKRILNFNPGPWGEIWNVQEWEILGAN